MDIIRTLMWLYLVVCVSIIIILQDGIDTVEPVNAYPVTFSRPWYRNGEDVVHSWRRIEYPVCWTSVMTSSSTFSHVYSEYPSWRWTWSDNRYSRCADTSCGLGLEQQRDVPSWVALTCKRSAWTGWSALNKHRRFITLTAIWTWPAYLMKRISVLILTSLATTSGTISHNRQGYSIPSDIRRLGTMDDNNSTSGNDVCLGVDMFDTQW